MLCWEKYTIGYVRLPQGPLGINDNEASSLTSDGVKQTLWQFSSGEKKTFYEKYQKLLYGIILIKLINKPFTNVLL